MSVSVDGEFPGQDVEVDVLVHEAAPRTVTHHVDQTRPVPPVLAYWDGELVRGHDLLVAPLLPREEPHIAGRRGLQCGQRGSVPAEHPGLEVSQWGLRLEARIWGLLVERLSILQVFEDDIERRNDAGGGI